MNTPSPSESNPPDRTSTDRELSLEMLQEQHLNLKVSVEELYSRVNQIRGLLQTLVMGLAIAILLAIGISGWFAYRLLVQEEITRRDTEQATATNAKMLEQLKQIETQLQRQKDQIETFREEVPDELKTLTDTIQANQRQLQILRDRIKQIEPKQSLSNPTQ